MEIREPASWILAIIALAFAVGGAEALKPSFLTSPHFIGILVGFVTHELAHREVSRRYGLRASFIAYAPSLVITFLSGLLPVKILAPGYVKIYGYGPSVGVFYATLAGPATNIAIAIASLYLSLVMGYGWLAPVAKINAWMAFFNLLPIPPLDGSKILSHSLIAWAGLIGMSATLLYLW